MKSDRINSLGGECSDLPVWNFLELPLFLKCLVGLVLVFLYCLTP